MDDTGGGVNHYMHLIMAPIKLYIATTIDGYIARKDGNLDWLHELPNPDKLDFGYHDFYAGIDTVILGRQTYEEVLGFDVGWPYAQCTTYVATTQPDYKLKSPKTELLPTLNSDTIATLRQQSEKAIWLVGGGALVTSFLQLDAIDELHLFIIPTLLGEGVPLFPGKGIEAKFRLKESKTYENGGVMLVYERGSWE
jgi:dihydrofolate reductase